MCGGKDGGFVSFPGAFFMIMYSLEGFSELLGIGLDNCLYLVLLLSLLLNSYLGLGESIAQPYNLGLLMKESNISFALIWKGVIGGLR